MADEILRSKHAFGALERVLEAISSGKVDAYDVLFLKDENKKPYIGWVDKDGNPVIIKEEEKIVYVDELPETGVSGKIYIFGEDGYFWNGEKFVNLCKPTDVSTLEKELSNKADAEEVEADISALESEIATKVTAEEVKTIIKESSDSFVEIVEF